MGLFDWLWGWFAGNQPAAAPQPDPRTADSARSTASPGRRNYRAGRRRPKARLTLRHSPAARRRPRPGATLVAEAPYRFARRSSSQTGWLDLSLDSDPRRLQRFGLPALTNSEDVARWLRITPGELAWLAGRFWNDAPPSVRQSHYHYVWINKRRGGRRLLEVPKLRLRAVQDQILRLILDRVPPHAAAHGFVGGRSHRTNAAAHVDSDVLLKLDLENFYPSVTFSRVTAIFRGFGFSREAAGWLARLTTSAVPVDALAAEGSAALRDSLVPYRRRHLPQGAPTSPALANLSAFVLDLRLAGLARSFAARYTRYADDITFSGEERFRRSIAVFLPLVREILSNEHFKPHPGKLRVERRGQRQMVTGVVVNTKVNVRRDDFDRLKAILTNCLRYGPTSQNRDAHPAFASHLRGRIAHVQSLNAQRGEKLLAIFSQIDWNR